MFLLRTLKQEDEYASYRNNFNSSLKSTRPENTIPLTSEYMERSQVFGLFDEHNHMVAGFILGFNSSFRLLEFIPPHSKLLLPSQFQWSQCCEIVCMWKKPNVTRLEMINHVWIEVFQRFLDSSRLYLLGHNQAVKLGQYYSIVGPKKLYIGPSIFGLPSQLFIYSRLKIKLLKHLSMVFYYWLEFKKSFKSPAGAKETL